LRIEGSFDLSSSGSSLPMTAYDDVARVHADRGP
jgi:hypothetical protein